MRVLFAEDERALSHVLTTILERNSYEVEAVYDGSSALDCLLGNEYDVAVLDIMMPNMNGLEVLRFARAQGVRTPVIMLTAKGTIDDRVEGLDAGANDYLVKPFAFDEFSARVRALLRRGSDTKSTVLSLADLTLNTTNRKIVRGERNITLTSTEYALLEYLLRNQRHVLTRSQIADHVWNYDFEYDSNVVDVYIRYLRNKIDRDFPVKLIHTVRGTGYVVRGEE